MKKENELKEHDIVEEVKFEIDRDAFKGPFTCCNVKTKKVNKKMSIRGTDFSYDVWQCSKCKKEFLDTEQAQRLEKIWMIEKILDEKLISIERNVNYDGKTFFVRFPVEVTKKWHKGAHADIKLLSPEEFFIKIKT
jgi:hypothetical protein